MKEGWEYKKLGEVANFISGYTPNQEEISNQGEYPYFKVAEMNIAGNELYMKNTSLFVNSPKKIYPKGSIIFPKNGGAIYTEKKRILDVDSVIDLNTEAIFPTAQIELMYLYFLLTFTKISSFDKGGGLPSLDLKKMSESIIPVPPLSEQQRIVDYLDSAFAKIDAMKANAEKALNEAKALFQASLKEMLEPKEGWEEKKLGDICSDIRYGTSTPSNENGEYKYLRMNNITNDGFLDVSHYKTISLPEKELEKCLVKRGDIIFNRTNSRELVGKSCVFTEDEKMVIAGYLIRIRVRDGFEPQFITYSMNLQRSLGLFQHLIVGAVHQANISANNIQKVIINYPPLSEQQSIVETLDSLKSKVDRLQANYDKISQECDALKQAILRQVFE